MDNTSIESQLEQAQALNKVLLEMNKNQNKSNEAISKAFIATIICMTILLAVIVLCFFGYESRVKSAGNKPVKAVIQEFPYPE